MELTPSPHLNYANRALDLENIITVLPLSPLSPPLPSRSIDGYLYQDLLSKRQELPLEERLMEQPSPGTLV